MANQIEIIRLESGNVVLKATDAFDIENNTNLYKEYGDEVLYDILHKTEDSFSEEFFDENGIEWAYVEGDDNPERAISNSWTYYEDRNVISYHNIYQHKDGDIVPKLIKGQSVLMIKYIVF